MKPSPSQPSDTPSTPEPRVVCYCEREAFAASVLVARMEDAALDHAPVWDDLGTFDGRPWRGVVDTITAGFPCQPWSVAGRRKGTDDERWIWDEIVGIISTVQPRMLFLENTPGLLWAGQGQRQSGIELCLESLAAMGFDAAWGVFSAKAVGGSHLRKRVFIVADAAGGRCREGHKKTGEPCQGARTAGQRGGHSDGGAELADTKSRGFGELRSASGGAGYADREDQGVADAGSARLQGRKPGILQSAGRRGEGGAVAQLHSAQIHIHAPGPDSPEWPAIIHRHPHLTPAIEPSFCVLADGDANTLDITVERAGQLRLGGNSVAPVCAAVAFTVLRRALERERNGGHQDAD
jgi:DNA (cytosine-5)-methyltransferase 1